MAKLMKNRQTSMEAKLVDQEGWARRDNLLIHGRRKQCTITTPATSSTMITHLQLQFSRNTLSTPRWRKSWGSRKCNSKPPTWKNYGSITTRASRCAAEATEDSRHCHYYPNKQRPPRASTSFIVADDLGNIKHDRRGTTRGETLTENLQGFKPNAHSTK